MQQYCDIIFLTLLKPIVYVSKKADQYMDTSVKESLDLKFEGKTQLEIMRRDVRQRGGDPALVRGTGVWKQHLNLKLRSNPFVGPYSPGKRPIWAYKHIRPLESIFIYLYNSSFSF